ncbi:CAP domain-containing protein [Virgibacillus sp. C22-A2]|uniref:CAP domain-containing protein n=1 Tax=Virgibacillus tibetensis TaxID=3042313 RepID=A0ABU6KF17_9BACI|nr:CAP domain-containing protein [Virgibacillus sp. C22-A2]
MKNRIYRSTIGLLFLTLVACNTEQGALERENYVVGNESDTISSLDTSSSSEEYPHTIPVKIQDAKFDFEIVEQEIIDPFLQQDMGQRDNQTQQIERDSEQRETENRNIQRGEQRTNEGQHIPPGQEQGTNQQQESDQQQGEQDTESRDFESAVIDFTNEERRREGLSELKEDPSLSEVAKEKSKDMQSNGYFSHTSPNYGSPFDMMRDFGVSYQSAGENIAQGQRSPDVVVQEWMNSEGHRENILNGGFTHIGVGYVEDGNYWTQMFITK